MNAIVSKADLDDQQWLDQQVATLGDGIEAARAIWANWSDGRNVGRLCDGLTYGAFIHRELPSLGPDDVPRLVAAVPEMSNPEIARIVGVDQSTVYRARKALQDANPDAEPARVIGADGKSYPGRVIREVTAEVIEPDPDLPRGRPVPKRTYPDWWREVGIWLSRARIEDAKALRELDARVHAAMLAAGLEMRGTTE
jgi:hypothetical protein